MRPAVAVLATALALPACAGGDMPYSQPMTPTYSQTELLKNWAMSACLAIVAKDAEDRADANATASAYMEFGHQDIEAYDALRKLAEKYAARKYAGSIDSEFNTMKCIDLSHSQELDRLTKHLAKRK